MRGRDQEREGIRVANSMKSDLFSSLQASRCSPSSSTLDLKKTPQVLVPSLFLSPSRLLCSRESEKSARQSSSLSQRPLSREEEEEIMSQAAAFSALADAKGEGGGGAATIQTTTTAAPAVSAQRTASSALAAALRGVSGGSYQAPGECRAIREEGSSDALERAKTRD